VACLVTAIGARGLPPGQGGRLLRGDEQDGLSELGQLGATDMSAVNGNIPSRAFSGAGGAARDDNGQLEVVVSNKHEGQNTRSVREATPERSPLKWLRGLAWVQAYTAGKPVVPVFGCGGAQRGGRLSGRRRGAGRRRVPCRR